VAALAERMTTKNSSARESCALEGAVQLDGIEGVLGTGRGKAALHA